MSKTSKISFKLYYNDRLKQVSFHGAMTYPLYVQVTHQRKTIFFKSNYFEMLSQSKYETKKGNKILAPTLQEIINQESRLIEDILAFLDDGFTLGGFKQLYDFYSMDLCQITEEVFKVFLAMFFMGKGISDLGKAIFNGSIEKVFYPVLKDMEQAFQPEMYNQIIEESLKQAQPYIPIYEFTLQEKKAPYLIFTTYDLDFKSTRPRFNDFLLKKYSADEAKKIIKLLDSLIEEYTKK